MRRREKFVIAAALLSVGLLIVQYIPLEFRYLAVGLFTLLSYAVTFWALKEDLQAHEWVTIVPFPALYAGAVGLFYFLLPESILSRVFVLVLFGIGMYALFLTSNIFSVAKGRTIQLLHAAHAIGLLFTLLTSLLFTNTIYSLRLPFYILVPLIALVHFPLILMSLWSIELRSNVSKEVVGLSAFLTLILAELSLMLTFFPISVWNIALLLMASLYIGLGILHSFLRGRLFSKTLNEYWLVATFVAIIFFLVFPLK
ncbi:MAG: hypothetical protein M3Q81_00860 [bacterium]|nr:hypothetical protein [bacterium]